MSEKQKLIDSGAQFSEDRKYRYALWRVWYEVPPRMAFIGLNPSTADETQDDPTIRRCIGFAKAWGFGGLYMLNLFAFRATDPDEMKRADDPVGPENDSTLARYAEECARIVAAWGNQGSYRRRDRAVRGLIPNLMCLRRTKAGQPEHPLYVPGDTQPIPYGIVRKDA